MIQGLMVKPSTDTTAQILILQFYNSKTTRDHFELNTSFSLMSRFVVTD